MKGIKILLFAFVIGFIGLVNVEAAACRYKNNSNNLTIECAISERGNQTLSCDFDYSSGITKEAADWSVTNWHLVYSDFLDDSGEVDCNQVPNIFLDRNTSNGSVQIIYGINNENSCPAHISRYNARPEDFLPGTFSESCDRYGLVYSTTDDTSDEGGVSSENGTIDSGIADEGVSTLNDFCSGTVLGAFTTIGWILFFLKIAIPVIIIVLGTIDLAKAVISSKDDAIKKSVKSLVLRAIAGILIFFIPTILSFIISLIDDNNIYNGSFKNCTQCMLDPMHEFENGTVCRKLYEK